MGKALPVHIRRNTHPKARPEAAPPAVPTGIDYLGLIRARRDAELTGRIDYAALADEGTRDHDEHHKDDENSKDEENPDTNKEEET
jgi:hypothetical protein